MNIIRRNEILKFVLNFVIALLLIFAMINFVRIRGIIATNRSLIEDELETTLSYATENRNVDYRRIEKLLERPYVNDNQKAILYSKSAILNHMDGNISDYYTNVGSALYYGTKSQNEKVLVETYCDLACFFIDCGDFERAKLMLDEASDYIDNVQHIKTVSSNYYRLRGIYFYKVEKSHAAAHESFEMAREGLDLNDWNQSRLYESADLEEALCYISQGNYALARKLVDKYEMEDVNLLREDGAYINRRIVIPYTEAQIKLDINGGNTDKIRSELICYIETCNESELYNKVFDIVLYYMTKTAVAQRTGGLDVFESQLISIYESMSGNYALQISDLLYSQVETTIDRLTHEDASHDAGVRRCITYSLVTFFVLLVLLGTYSHSKKLEEDALTTLGSRREFDKVITDFGSKEETVSAIMFDLDDFKKVNDTYGHEVGDYVLREFGKIVKAYKSNMTFPFRYGGEEFILITTFKDSRSVLEMAEDIRTSVENFKWEQGMKITVSCGVALHEDADDVVKVADENLYFTKQHGKNGVCFIKDDEQVLYV